MQCNAFSGYGYNNGQFCNSCSTSLHSNQSMYPEIVGEGQVTSVTLPDGTVQFYFMPTLKWWSPNAQCHSYSNIPNPMFANTNYSIPSPCNNVGTWFIRSISNSLPQNVFNPASVRNEFPRLAFNTDCNPCLNNYDLGYKVKFHNDSWTSTTDLVYFYPSLRQRNFVFASPSKDETVQTDIGPVPNNPVSCYELVCFKPCACSVGVKSMSIESLVDSDVKTKSINTIIDDSRVNISKKHDKRDRDKKSKRSISKNVICACNAHDNIVSTEDKSVTTYADEGISCTSTDGRETQTSKITESKCVDANPSMQKSILKPELVSRCHSGSSTADEHSSDDISKKRNKRQQEAKSKRNKPNACDCGCESIANSDSSYSEDETVASQDEHETSTCGSCSSVIMLEKSKRPKNAADKTSNEQNSFLDWLQSTGNMYKKCELRIDETCESLNCSSARSMEEESSDNLPNNNSNFTNCDSICNKY